MSSVPFATMYGGKWDTFVFVKQLYENTIFFDEHRTFYYKVDHSFFLSQTPFFITSSTACLITVSGVRLFFGFTLRDRTILICMQKPYNHCRHIDLYNKMLPPETDMGRKETHNNMVSHCAPPGHFVFTRLYNFSKAHCDKTLSSQ